MMKVARGLFVCCDRQRSLRKERRRLLDVAILLTISVLLVVPGSAAGDEIDDTASLMTPYVAVSRTSRQLLEELNDDSDRTLAVKQFDINWISKLERRGEPPRYTRDNSADFEYIGMPIGGICAGQLYLGGDGKLWCWDIFNTKSMRDTHHIHGHQRPYLRSVRNDPAHHYLNQGFVVRLAAADKTFTRTLDRDGFRNITFRGQYPIGEVMYEDPELPVRVELEAFSPFIPLDLENSVYPATVMVYTVTNTSDKNIKGELLGWLENAVCVQNRAEYRGQLRNQIDQSDELTLLACSAIRPRVEESEVIRREDVLFEDFEGDLGKWTQEGDSFLGNPRPNYHHQPLRGRRGNGLADSFRNGGKAGASAELSDRATGRLISKPFTIERKAIHL